MIGQAWLNRARRLLRDLEPSPVHGYLVYVDAGLAWEVDEDPGPAMEGATVLRDLARRFDDESLEALAGVLSGVAAVWTGRTTEGFGDLDEAMLAVVSGALPAQWAGDVYCTVIHLCHVLGDLVRMRAWTDALEQWATPLSTTFMFAGITRVHQLQLLSAEGDWHTVEHEVAGRSRELVGSHGWVAAEGFRELGDVRRLRGDTVGARSAYARTRDLGVTPQPGEALLDEAEGRRGEALAELRAALSEQGRVGRARLLLPTVEVALRAGDLALAELSAAELEATAALHDTPGLRAWSDHAAACLLLHHGAWDDGRQAPGVGGRRLPRPALPPRDGAGARAARPRARGSRRAPRRRGRARHRAGDLPAARRRARRRAARAAPATGWAHRARGRGARVRRSAGRATATSHDTS